MPFTMPSYPLLNSSQVNPFNGAVQHALENYSNTMQAAYLPYTLKANVLSKMAYGLLMGPQFMSKLLENKNVAANTPESTLHNLIPFLFNRGMSVSNPNMVGSPSVPNNANPSPTSTDANSNQPTSSAPSQSMNTIPPTDNASPNMPNALSNNPNTSPNMPTNQQNSQPQVSKEALAIAIDNFKRSPEGIAQAKKDGIMTIPDINTLMTNYGSDKKYKTYAENSGSFAGTVAEGEALGKERAQAISNYGTHYKSDLALRNSYQNMQSILTSPMWQEMRNNIPAFQDKQLSYLSKFGTPAQQKMIGEFIATAKNSVRDTLNSFSGARLKGELGVSQQANINNNDTVSEALGKLNAGMLFNDLELKYGSLVPKLMKENHIDEQEALEMADKMIDRKAIKDQISSQLLPVATQADLDHMVNKYKIPIDEVKKRVIAKGYRIAE